MPKMSSGDKERIISRYNERMDKHGVDWRTLNPGSPEKLEIQHRIHATIGDLANRTLLDIGCGLAYYYVFIQSQGIPVTYIGYDINEAFIASNRERFPGVHFEVRDVSNEDIVHEADYISLCQVFNNRYADADNAQVVKTVLAKAFKTTRMGVSIDMLGDYVNYREDHLAYFSPEEMFTFAKSLTRFVRLRNDYAEFHFTLFLYKEPSLP